jgi:NAD(P)-dependent dehydrogenase (short-subunit alcohol dehydrogenase family)
MSDGNPIENAVTSTSGTYRRPDRRVALVTGGGSGAGAAIARAYAQLGVRVVVSDIDYALAGTVAGEIRNGGGQALAHRCDVASEEQVIALIERAQREFGALTYVVNNAGPDLADDPLEHWMRIVGANLLGTMLTTRHAIDAMRDRGGSIVNVAADSGLGFGTGEQPAYAAAKAGILRFTASLRSLHAEQGIRVNCIVPDWIATEYRLATLQELTPAQRLARRIPEQLTTPEQFAAAVVALSQRETCGGRVLLCRAGQPLQFVQYGDRGYSQVEAF